jgi:copper(I)-binding protein
MKILLAAACLIAGPVFAGDVKIDDPWIRAMPPSSPATAAFMTIHNRSDKPVAVTGGTCPMAGEVKPMITTLTKVDGREVAGMEFVESFTVAPGKKRVLEPGGDHIMLMKLRSVPKAGTTVPLVIWIESGGRREKLALEVPVR